MGATSIEWTDLSWNPGIYGCQEISPACANCYAAKMAHRLVGAGHYPQGITERRTSGVHWTGQVATEKPNYVRYSADRTLPKRKPARVFVTSMSDLFHPDVPFDFLWAVFWAMKQRPHLTFQVLTKRPERMAALATSTWLFAKEGMREWPDNVWAGTTVEDQRRADERIPHLLRTPARVRFLSCEPLLGPVDLDQWVFDRRAAIRHLVNGPACLNRDQADASVAHVGIHWVIAGGESGPRARRSDLAWFRSLRNQCAEAGVAFFMKQMSEHGRADKKAIPADLMIREVPR